MTIDATKTKCQIWNKQHQQLTRLLKNSQPLPNAIKIFLPHHGAIHSARGNPECAWSYQDYVLSGLTEKQVRAIPAGCSHSIAWMVWHITRIEDITLNILLAGSAQLFRRGAWRSKLKAPTEEVGNAMNRDAVESLSRSLDWKALLAYRQAVGQRTRVIVSGLTRDQLKPKPAPDRLERIADEGAVCEQSQWLLSYWGGHPAANLLLMPATRHPFVHWNEAVRMRPRLTRREDEERV
jgi:hypothetical protein